jgi:NAD(P)-dependent dehydrogenase (short-subunit alcohol dehydrogenase family)
MHRNLAGHAGAAHEGRRPHHRSELMPYFQRLAAESIAFAGAAVKAMRPTRRGASCSDLRLADRRHTGLFAYAAARAAVNGVVRTLALEVAGDGISVNAVAANFIQTETYYPKALLEDPVKGPKLLARVPMGTAGRRPRKSQPSSNCWRLAKAGFVSGQVIPISGAWC